LCFENTKHKTQNTKHKTQNTKQNKTKYIYKTKKNLKKGRELTGELIAFV